MLKIAICDDNLNYCREMEGHILTWARERHLEVDLSSFDHGDALLNACHNQNPDIILLDIMMPLLNGMDTAREIRKLNTAVKIVFFTSSVEFAVESYDVKASGYLLKPLQLEKFYQVMDECVASMQIEPDYIVMKTHQGYQKIHLYRIDCIEAQNKRVVIYLNDCSCLDIFETFSNFTETLPMEKGFFKCHRSYIVYMPNIDQFTSTDIITKSGIHVPIARGYGKAFKDAYFHHMFERGE